MTAARIQPFCKNQNINIGCYDGFRVCPRSITVRNRALYMYKNHFFLVSKSTFISFNEAIQELKLNFKVVDNIRSDEHVRSFIKYEYKPNKVQFQLTNLIVYDLETFNTNGAVPYTFGLYKLSKILGDYFRDITQREFEKCRDDLLFSEELIALIRC